MLNRILSSFFVDNFFKNQLRNILKIVGVFLLARNVPESLVTPFLQSTEALLLGAGGTILTYIWSTISSKKTKEFKN